MLCYESTKFHKNKKVNNLYTCTQCIKYLDRALSEKNDVKSWNSFRYNTQMLDIGQRTDDGRYQYK